MEVYSKPIEETTADPPASVRAPSGQDRRYAFRKAIEAVKAKVGTVDVADFYAGAGRLRRVGDRWVGRCVLPDHEDRSPSFVAYPETDSWYCFGCSRGGDAIDLEKLAGGHTELWTAVLALASRYGVDMPERPEKWRRWTTEKGKRRRMLAEARIRLYQRRLLRLFRADLEAIPDPNEREAEARRLYEDLYPLAYACAAYRAEIGEETDRG